MSQLLGDLFEPLEVNVGDLRSRKTRVAGDGSSSLSWPFPSNTPAGSYEVFARWTSGANRASNAVPAGLCSSNTLA